jgi:hypothetical protein
MEFGANVSILRPEAPLLERPGYGNFTGLEHRPTDGIAGARPRRLPEDLRSREGRSDRRLEAVGEPSATGSRLSVLPVAGG